MSWDLARRIVAWWRRSVTVERVDEERDEHRIVMDAGDGSPVQELVVPRNDLYSIAWLLAQTRTWRALESLTWTSGEDPERQVAIVVPTWARADLVHKVTEAARAVGWKGEVYVPYQGGPFR